MVLKAGKSKIEGDSADGEDHVLTVMLLPLHTVAT
jgi:hypothetical protein